jgi:starch phosphorylase
VQKLLPLADDERFLDELAQVKLQNKRDLSALVQRRTGVELPADAMVVIQIKRFHEYKRQLLACLAIVAHYMHLKRNPGADTAPRAYIFAGKAAPGYAMAKLHIKLLNDVAAVINADPAVRGRLAVVFLPNYGVSLAQALIPAADVSVQISTAGKEASGTSNMKFALNGALTLGTLDGANVEIRDAVGPENFFLFGLTTPEVAALWAAGYDPGAYIARSAALSEALDLIAGGFFSLGEIDRFQPIIQSLRYHDPFLVCADFDAYQVAEAHAASRFRDARAWSRSALYNIVGAARFSSDATVQRYADEIWRIQPEKTDLSSIGDA